MIFSVEQEHSAPHKVWRGLFLKGFHGRWERIYWGADILGGLMIRSWQGRGSFANTFFSNHFLFFQSRRDIHLKIKLRPKLWKYLYLRLIVKKFQKLCHVQPDLDIFVKLTVQIGDCIKKNTLCTLCLRVVDFIQSLPSFVVSRIVTCTLMPWLQSSFWFA